MGTVTIGATDYTVYGTAAGFTEHAQADLAYATTYAAASADNKSRAHVTATRMIDRQGLVNEDDEDITSASASIPTAVIEACYELALAGLADNSIFTTTDTSKNVQQVGAGAASVQFFAPVKGGRFPARVMELLAPYFPGAGTSTAGSIAYGTDGASAFDDCDAYGLTGAG